MACVAHSSLFFPNLKNIITILACVPRACAICCTSVCVLSHFNYVWLCDHMDHSPPGSSVHGILQARILEWVAISPSRGSSWPRDWTYISYVSCTDSWILYEADSSVGLSEKLGHIQFSRQEYWSGLPCPPPRDLPNPGIEPTSPVSPALQMDSLPAEPQGKPGPMAYPLFITCG